MASGWLEGEAGEEPDMSGPPDLVAGHCCTCGWQGPEYHAYHPRAERLAQADADGHRLAMQVETLDMGIGR